MSSVKPFSVLSLISDMSIFLGKLHTFFLHREKEKLYLKDNKNKPLRYNQS